MQPNRDENDRQLFAKIKDHCCHVSDDDNNTDSYELSLYAYGAQTRQYILNLLNLTCSLCAFFSHCVPFYPVCIFRFCFDTMPFVSRAVLLVFSL